MWTRSSRRLPPPTSPCASAPTGGEYFKAKGAAQRARAQGVPMKRSTDRILTTHVGSLIRPAALQDFLRAKQAGKAYDTAAYDKCLSASVADVVHKQAEVGIDVISDGEFGKSISW